MIVPCGLQRPVTSLEQILGDNCPSMERVKSELTKAIIERINACGA